MSDKSKNPKKTPSTKTFRGAIYPSIAGGVNAILKEQARGELYPIADFYKPSLVSKALETANGGRVRVTTVQGSSIDIDRAEIKQKLANNLKALKAFYDKQKSKTLAVTYYQRVSDETAETLKQYFEYDTFKPTGNNTADIYNQTGNTRIIIPPENTKVQGSINGYALTDKPKLQKALDKLPKTKILLHKDVEIQTSVASAEANTIEGLKQLFTDVIDLAKACNIKDDGTRVLSIGDVEVSQTHLELLSTVSLTLATVQELNKTPKSRTVTNIKEAEKHSYIIRPANMTLLETFYSAIEGDKDLKSIFTSYRNVDEQAEAHGLHLYVDEQQKLPLFKASDDYETIKQMLLNQVPMLLDTVLILQAYKRDYPDNQWVDLKTLATYLPRYARDITTKGSLRPEYRQALYNNLKLLQYFEIPYYDRPSNKEGGKIYKYFRFINIDEVEVNKGKIIAVNADFTPEYTATYSHKIGVILDGLIDIESTNAKMLADYIADVFVANKPRTIRTIEGKPIVKTASDLITRAGITTQNVTKKYSLLSDYLDEIAKDGRIMSKWTTPKGQKITGYGKAKGKVQISLYPSDNLINSYIDRDTSKAERNSVELEQKNRHTALNKYAKGYTDYDVLADELGTTRRELDLMLDNKQPITDEVLEKIDLEII